MPTLESEADPTTLSVHESPAFLGVTESVTGQRWTLRPSDDRLTQAIAQRLDVPDIVARVMAGRGIGLEDAANFFNPTLRDALPDPSVFKDMDIAVDRLVLAVREGEQIVIFGDYDVDGATSAALLTRYLRAVDAKTGVYIPDRLKEGYGPNIAALRQLHEEGATVCITVDCGTTAVAPLGEARMLGLDIIVVDHHQAEVSLPPVCALINPNRQDEAPEVREAFGNLAAVGVAFMLVIGLNRGLRQAGWFEDRVEPNPLEWLDLVALGTICDVVPLLGLNRPLVAQGLKVMAKRANTGIAALADVAGVNEPPGAYHAGFVLGPRVNAGGRVGRSDMGAQLLITHDQQVARQLATELDIFNSQRREIEAKVQAAAETILAQRNVDEPIIIVSAEGWHPGVIGIVASRLKDRYRRPVFVVATQDGIGKGSGRSIPEVDLGAAVMAARQEGLLENGGGHKMAAGLTVRTDKLDALRQFFNTHYSAAVGAVAKVPELRLDGALAAAGASPALVVALEQAGPYGSGYREPRFAIADANVVQAKIVGENHVSCQLADSGGGGRLKAIAFRAMDGPLGPALLKAHKRGTGLHLVGHLRVDRWMGREQAQLFIDDVALVAGR